MYLHLNNTAMGTKPRRHCTRPQIFCPSTQPLPPIPSAIPSDPRPDVMALEYTRPPRPPVPVCHGRLTIPTLCTSRKPYVRRPNPKPI